MPLDRLIEQHGRPVRAARSGEEILEHTVDVASDQITQRNLGIQPTITIRPGAPVRMVVHKDLVLAPAGKER